ncbi:MAG: 50S ribosomal protein L32 [SAR324 cluster bacterium]|nr:50S ribosomal protein L32 [SAR324 cluster bacterium]
MAVPKRRVSRVKRDSRRSHNTKLKTPGLSVCTNCRTLILPHRICPHCGHYKGVAVIETDSSLV